LWGKEVRVIRKLGVATAVWAVSLAMLLPGTARADSFEPVPIPGGFTAPDGTVFHVFAPGPKSQGFQGFDVEPNVITNFRGFTALAYMVGTATDSKGNTYDMFNDMRVFQGKMVDTDGVTHNGTFVFI